MKPRDVRKYLFEMKAAGELVGSFTEGKTLEDYLGDPMLRAAVERPFEIIGEALNQAMQVDPALREQVTDAPRIIAFRNRLIHGYSAVSDEVVWGVVEASLPRLTTEIADLLED